MMDDAEFDRIILQLAEVEYISDYEHEIGTMSEAEFKETKARIAEVIQALDEKRGTADVTYKQFRKAFDKGVDCHGLNELKNRMHPHDPLKKDANKDLQSIGCYTARHHRTDRKGLR